MAPGLCTARDRYPAVTPLLLAARARNPAWQQAVARFEAAVERNAQDRTTRAHETYSASGGWTEDCSQLEHTTGSTTLLQSSRAGSGHLSVDPGRCTRAGW